MLNNSIAFIVDPQIQFSSPANRTDNYFQTMIRKFKEVLFANKYTVVLGDLTEFPVLDMAGVIVLVSLLKKYKKAGGTCFCLVGNHDLYNWAYSSFSKSTLGLLSELDLVQIIDSSGEVQKAVKEIEIEDWIIQCTNLKDPRKDFPISKQDKSILIGHNYFEFERDKKHSLEYKDLEACNFKFIFLGHDHRPYKPKIVGKSILYRAGSLGRGTADSYNFDRKIQYYQLNLDTDEVQAIDVEYEPASEVFSLQANEKHNDTTPKYVYDLEELMANFKQKRTANISIKKKLEENDAVSDEVFNFIADCYEQCNVQFI